MRDRGATARIYLPPLKSPLALALIMLIIYGVRAGNETDRGCSLILSDKISKLVILDD